MFSLFSQCLQFIQVPLSSCLELFHLNSPILHQSLDLLLRQLRLLLQLGRQCLHLQGSQRNTMGIILDIKVSKKTWYILFFQCDSEWAMNLKP